MHCRWVLLAEISCFYLDWQVPGRCRARANLAGKDGSGSEVEAARRDGGDKVAQARRLDLIVAEPSHGRGVGRDVDVIVVGVDQEVSDADEREVGHIGSACVPMRDDLVAGPEQDTARCIHRFEAVEGGVDSSEIGTWRDRQSLAKPSPTVRVDRSAEVGPTLAKGM